MHPVGLWETFRTPMKRTMKRSFWWLWLFVLLFLAASLSGCSLYKPKAALTAEQFRDKMSDAGYSITDATDQFEKGSVEIVLIAGLADHQIEFYVMPTVAKAETAFAVNRSDIEAIAGSGFSNSKSLTGINYNSYARTTAEGCYFVSRIENTLVFVSEEAKEGKAIREIIKQLGY